MGLEFEIEKLAGETNFETWMAATRAYLKMIGLWETVNLGDDVVGSEKFLVKMFVCMERRKLVFDGMGYVQSIFKLTLIIATRSVDNGNSDSEQENRAKFVILSLIETSLIQELVDERMNARHIWLRMKDRFIQARRYSPIRRVGQAEFDF